MRLKIKDWEQFTTWFWFVAIFAIYTIVIFLVNYIRYLIETDQKYLAVLILLIFGFSVILFIVISRDVFKSADRKSERRLNSMKRVNLYSRHVVGGLALGIISKTERGDVARNAIEFLEDKKLRKVYYILDAFLRYQDRKTVDTIMDALETDGSKIDVDDDDTDEDEQALLTEYLTDSIDQQVGSQEYTVFHRRMSVERVPWVKVPLEELVERKFSSFLTDRQVRAIHQHVEKLYPGDDPLVVFTELDENDLKQIITADVNAFVAKAAKDQVDVEFAAAVESLNQVRLWLKYTVDVLSTEELRFFKKNQINNMMDLRVRKEDVQLERQYNTLFREIRGTPVTSTPDASKAPKKGKFYEVLNLVKKKLTDTQAKFSYVRLETLVDTLVNAVMKREAELHVRFNNDKRAQLFNAKHFKNFDVQFPDCRSHEIDFDRTFFVEEPVTRPDGSVEYTRVECNRAHLIVPGPLEEVLEGGTMTMSWEGRSGMVCTNLAEITVVPLFWFKDREPALLVTYSLWHEQFYGDLAKQFSLHKLFKTISGAYVSRIQDTQSKLEELERENQSKDKIITAQVAAGAKDRLIRKVNEGMQDFQKRVRTHANYRLYTLPIGWILVIGALVALFSWASFMVGFNWPRGGVP